ncbi:sarcosine oxidase subunit gamma [Brevibacterium litoralis]|uniref:sarcosine oxidase subunit gamma n=1 Tax=Brevibacterium litoralis TaxID=3138935 RepID=UPI0032EA931F
MTAEVLHPETTPGAATGTSEGDTPVSTPSRPVPLDRRTSPAGSLHADLAAASVGDEETWATTGRGVRLREVPFLTQVGIRAVPGTATRAQVEALLGAPLPTRAGATAAVPGTGGLLALWLSPDEYLLVGTTGGPEEPTGTEVVGQVCRTVAGTTEPGEGGGIATAAVLDLSANRTTFEVAGPSARDLLRTGVPLDVHPEVFAVGSAYVTTLGKVSVVLHRTGADTYRVMPRSSFAVHVGRWLIGAAAEFAVPAPPS